MPDEQDALAEGVVEAARTSETAEYSSEVGRSASYLQVPSGPTDAGMGHLEAKLRIRDQRIAELTSQLLERERSISVLLKYVNNNERSLATQIAAVTETDLKIATLQQKLGRSGWRSIVADIRDLLRAMMRRLYHELIPPATRVSLWKLLHRYEFAARRPPVAEGETVKVRMGCSHLNGCHVPIPSVAIVTRNAVHGGVERMVALHQQQFHAKVFVAGGMNRPDTCPFEYTYIDSTNEVHARQRLASCLHPYDVVIYHWLPGWAQCAVRDADRPCIEVVHRADTSDNDKTIPTLIVTHSEYLARYLRREFSRDAWVIPHGLDISQFPSASSLDGQQTGMYVGAITTYDTLKGVDLFLSAWATIQHEFPQYRVRFYGSGAELEALRELAKALRLEQIEMLGPTSSPEAHIKEFRLFVAPSRADGLPFAVLEALASNVPVICSDIDSVRELNDTAVKRGFPAPVSIFETESILDFADKLRKSLSNSNLGADTRLYIQQYFSTEEHCRLYRLAMEEATVLHRNANNTAWPPASVVLPTTHNQNTPSL